jgi:hypothetical protein
MGRFRRVTFDQHIAIFDQALEARTAQTLNVRCQESIQPRACVFRAGSKINRFGFRPGRSRLFEHKAIIVGSSGAGYGGTAPYKPHGAYNEAA